MTIGKDEAFAAGAEWAGISGFVEWMYAELFEMPLVPDPFDAPTHKSALREPVRFS